MICSLKKHLLSRLWSPLWRGVILFSLIAGPGHPTRPAFAQENICRQPHQSVSRPLTELGNNVYIRMDGQNTGETGGLYPGGANERPPTHEAAGLAQAAQITPLDVDGNPDPENGKIVMISVGMSNTSSEFNAFINAANEAPEINPQVKIINGAQGNRVSGDWVEPNAPTWSEVFGRLNRYNASPAQVQVAWVKQTQTRGGDFPDKALALQNDLEAIARSLKSNFPNIKIAYFSSRTRSYTYWRGLSPEPVAFETGFAVKWLIEKQIIGDPALNYTPDRGEVVAPYLSWGPYLWADGTNPREDGLTWLAEDMRPDCTHPSQTGNQKVARMLLAFFKEDTTARSWFLRDGPVLAVENPTAPPAPTGTTESTAPPAPTDTALPEPTVTASPAPSTTAESTPPAAVTAAATPTATPSPSQAESRQNLTFGLITGAAGIGVGLGIVWLLYRRKS